MNKSVARGGFATLGFMLALSTQIICSVAQSTGCSSSLCNNHGVCLKIDNDPTDFICSCEPGYEGLTCEECNGRVRLNSSVGFITDGPGDYSVMKHCSYILSSENNSRITLSLDHFHTECNWDIVSIFDGDSIHAPKLAALSGFIRGNETVLEPLELTSTGSNLFIHFYSDKALFFSGFNISYSTQTACLNNCSGHGTCTNGDCTCRTGFEGDYCQREICPANCSGNGLCTVSGCACNQGYKGNDCGTNSTKAVWTSLRSRGSPVQSAGHVLLHMANELWLVGGYRQAGSFLHRYSLESGEWKPEVNGKEPPETYGHSAVIYQGSIIVFGGTVDDSPVNHLWRWSPSTGWRLTDDGEPTRAVTGHSAHVINADMYVFFGYSAYYGYQNLVQKYNINSSDWSVVSTRGALVHATFGHSSVYDSSRRSVWLYAGMYSSSSGSTQLHDQLLQFHVDSHTWTVHRYSGVQSFLQSMTLLGNSLYVFGGNQHNETATTGGPCFSNSLLVYDIPCGRWYQPDVGNSPSARYSQSAVAANSSLYMYGGFDGRLHADLYMFSPANCEDFTDPVSCESSRANLCFWTNGSCSDQLLNSTDITRTCSLQPTPSDREMCMKLGSSCQSCTNSAMNCSYCVGLKSSPRPACNLLSDCSVTNPTTGVAVSVQVVSPEQCTTPETGCERHTSCLACTADNLCMFNEENNCVETTGNITGVPREFNFSATGSCDSPCGSFNSCSECTSERCLWCGSPALCVDTHSYVTRFPFSQCLDWATETDRCPEMTCDSQGSCSDCQSNAACGWCSHRNDTGMGQCLVGEPSKPIESGCSDDQWFYLQCPLCQCNGHSECYPGTSQCISCQHHTTGDQCQFCAAGYWGNPQNGQLCQRCSCNGHATQCNNQTGECLCTTRGVIGQNCEQCDTRNRYYGNPLKGTCYYNLSTDYQFTFTLSAEQDRQYTQINLMNTPHSEDKDVELSVEVSQLAKINITFTKGAHTVEELLLSRMVAKDHHQKFKHGDNLNFGHENSTFRVYVYSFSVPFKLTVSFSQQPQIVLINFFVIFFSCFLALIIIAAIVWKVKVKYDIFRRQQRLQIQMVAMASRPFASIQLDLTRIDDPSSLGTGPAHAPLLGVSSLSPGTAHLKPALIGPTPAALEPLSSGKAGVLSVLMSLPTGEDDYTPAGQAGLVIASTLILLSRRRSSQDRATKIKQKRSSIPREDRLRHSSGDRRNRERQTDRPEARSHNTSGLDNQTDPTVVNVQAAVEPNSE